MPKHKEKKKKKSCFDIKITKTIGITRFLGEKRKTGEDSFFLPQTQKLSNEKKDFISKIELCVGLGFGK